MPKTKTSLREKIIKILVGYDRRYTVASLSILTDQIIKEVNQTMKKVIGLTEELAYYDPERKEKLDIRNQLRKEQRNRWQKELKGK